jgi:exopolysaccharide biosynthesis polyprenyl glycosylphosphotransferase
MTAPNRGRLLALLKIADLAVVTLSFVFAFFATGGATGPDSWLQLLQMRIQVINELFMAGYLLLWHFILRSYGLYRSYRLSGISRELRDIGAAVLVAAGCLAPAQVLFGFEFMTIPFLLALAIVAFVGLGVERRFVRAVARRVRRYGRNLRNVIVVGTGDRALDLTSRLARREDLGYYVVGVIEPNASDTSHTNGGGNRAVLERLENMIEHYPIDEIFVALPLDSSQTLVRDIIGICEEQGISIRVLAHVAALHWARARVDQIEGQPVLTMYTGRTDTLGLLLKRGIDLVGAAFGLVLLAPLFLLAAAAIKLSSPGPVLFLQERVGLNRRRFRAYKFRTMVNGAEEMQPSLEPLNEAQGPVFKIENDPRITPVGRWLRRISIDELPQLFNVLKGEMSLVGPRPLPLRDVSRIDVRWHKRRFSVKPGITCLWQVNSRQPKFDEWIKSDMEYIDNWSVKLDLKILAKTIPAVLSGQGAH